MIRNFHKKNELLKFTFIDSNNEYITTSNIIGQNFSYIKKENEFIIQIILKRTNDIEDFNIFFEKLQKIIISNEHIIKNLKNINELNFNIILEIYNSPNNVKKYELDMYFEINEVILNTKYIKID